METAFNQTYFERIIASDSKQMKANDYELIRKVAPPQGSILDIGCGTGSFGKQLGQRVTFCDISPLSKNYLEGYNFVCSPAESTPFSDESFDTVYCLQMISHAEDVDAVMKEMLRITKKGGKLVIIGPNLYYVSLLRLLSFIRLVPKFNFDSTARWLLTPKSLKNRLVKSGWVTVSFFAGEKFRGLSLLSTRVVSVSTKPQ